jgi:hypothetical protein
MPSHPERLTDALFSEIFPWIFGALSPKQNSLPVLFKFFAAIFQARRDFVRTVPVREEGRPSGTLLESAGGFGSWLVGEGDRSRPSAVSSM